MLHCEAIRIGYLIVENEPIMSDNIQQQKNVQKYGHQFRKDLRISCMRFLSYAGFLKFSELAIYTCSLKRFDISLFTNNISVISWRSVLFVEETGAPGENHRPAASH
jgi:hypothetical protein